jgi:hypothetical protein
MEEMLVRAIIKAILIVLGGGNPISPANPVQVIIVP